MSRKKSVAIRDFRAREAVVSSNKYVSFWGHVHFFVRFCLTYVNLSDILQLREDKAHMDADMDILALEIEYLFHDAANRRARKTDQRVGASDRRCVAEWKQREAWCQEQSDISLAGCSGYCAGCLESCALSQDFAVREG